MNGRQLSMSTRLQVVFLSVSVAAQVSLGADWPQWRHDAMRSGATGEGLPKGIKQQWSLSLGRPAPAYEHQYRMCADFSYAPVAGQGLLFVPSSVIDQVMAFDLETGALKWRYVTGGPVRFAPVYDAGKVYFVSDDGYLCCVGAKTGELIWRRRGVPESNPDMLMLVNGRMVSRWPARGAPVLQEGTIYFGAGIWPEEGVYQNAIDARTGGVIWRSDALSFVKDGMCDHGANYDISLPPQGYSAVINGKLAVASGRTLAAWFDLKTGKLDPYTCFYVKFAVPRGAWYVAGNDRFWVQGGNWFAASKHALPPKPAGTKVVRSPLSISQRAPGAATFVMENRPFLCSDKAVSSPRSEGLESAYSDWIVTDDTMYATVHGDAEKYAVVRGHTFVRHKPMGVPFDRLVARDLTRPEWRVYEKPAKKNKGPYDVIEFPVKWEMKTSLKAIIKAGNQLIAGEENKVAAIDIPKEGGAPSVAWEAAVKGTPVNALVSDGKLVVVSDLGHVHCFGAGPERDVAFRVEPKVEHSPKNGYAYALGWGDGAAVLELAKDPEWRIVVMEKDSAAVAKARGHLNGKGIHGRRVQVIPVEEGLASTPYWASLVVVNDPVLFGDKEKTLSHALDAMRPFTGKMELTASVDEGVMRKLIAGKADYRLSGSTLARSSAPEGAADWTHEAAGADNSFVSRDKLVKWPLGVLWYSGDIDRFFTPETQYQHDRNPYPLVQDGRLYIITIDRLHAVDAYTGSYLWGTKMPSTAYLNGRLMDSRLYGRPTERNYVVAGDRVYCITGKSIRMYNTQTGEDMGALSIPEEFHAEAVKSTGPLTKTYTQTGEQKAVQSVPEWTEVRLWDDLLISMLGRNLVALDRRAGETKWMRTASRRAITYALGGDALYGIDCEPDKFIMDRDQFQKTATLFALNPTTGEELWSTDFNYPSWVKTTMTSLRPWMKPPMPRIGYNARHKLLIVSYNVNDAIAFHAGDGAESWRYADPKMGKFAKFSPPNILDDHLIMTLSAGGLGYLVDIKTGKRLREQCEIPNARTCGRPVGNDHLVSYRDAATELYDIDSGRTIPFNSMRAGCTSSLIPAGGVMSAPMLGHGCVCNYPMFASLALYHLPGSDAFRPDAVKESWGADQRAQAATPKAKRQKGR